MGEFENEISSNLERADTNLQVARELLEKSYYDVSASRAYYAAFYAASALLCMLVRMTLTGQFVLPKIF